MSGLSMKIARDILKRNDEAEMKEDIGFVIVTLRDNNKRVFIKAGANYEGIITDLGEDSDDGFWMTENGKTEEYISYVDIEEIKILN